MPLSRDAIDAAALRSQLLSLFPVSTRAPYWIDLSGVNLAAFDIPKDVHPRQPLLWTTQTDALWNELLVEPDGDFVRSQILAGPSGIGKSHIALLLALRCYAVQMPVLYVPDAGELLSSCLRSAGLPWASIDSQLLQKFAVLNADVAPTAASYRISYDSVAVPYDASFMRLLHECRAVVILDEHGHAFNKLVDATPPLDPSVVFPLLMPNSYNDKRFIRCVFAGSNQARFEGVLNHTYRPCLRFIVPFTENEAQLFLSKVARPSRAATVSSAAAASTSASTSMSSADDLSLIEHYTSFVPREMIRMMHASYVEDYVSNRRVEMGSSLRQMADAMDKSSLKYASMVLSLREFFHASKMGMGAEPYSFLDLGYVYRRGSVDTALSAVPLCYPATLALLDLFRFVMPPENARLAEVRGDGAAFEELIWGVLMARGFVESGIMLPCHVLGAEAPVEPVILKLDEYFISSLAYPNTALKQSAVNQQLAALLGRCKKLRLSCLYRCPTGGAGVDFFVLQSDGSCSAIQTSLSALTAHSSAEEIIGIARRYEFVVGPSSPHAAAVSGSATTTAAILTRYIYITVKPEKHTGLAKDDRLAHVRIVDAAELIGV